MLNETVLGAMAPFLSMFTHHFNQVISDTLITKCHYKDFQSFTAQLQIIPPISRSQASCVDSQPGLKKAFTQFTGGLHRCRTNN